jgi:transcription elongation factor GreA
MRRVPMTPRGAEKLRKELRQLKNVERPRIIQAIAEARSHGDLKENAEYHAARDQQGFVEGRIKEIEGKLSNCEVIDVSRLHQDGRLDGRVVFGSTVKLFDLESDQEIQYQIVGEDEANIKEGLISVSSPIARGLIAKEEGDEVKIEVPDGMRLFEILEVNYL